MSPGARFGPYEIVSQLGVGGMGEVYRARDPQLKRDVAIKILPAAVTADADRLARFQREAEVLASLNHANIAQVFGLADSDGTRGIVMELAEGETLAERLLRGLLPLDEALPIATQIADALEMAHERGIVHRDLKPANITVTSDGVVKVLDFGLAKALGPAADVTANAATFSSPAMTRAGIILGTAAYMSPEQARGRVVDARSDIWAFGCVLFEMLAGRRPFDGETVTDLLGAIVHKEPEWALLPTTLPDSLRRVLERCLAKEQKQRLHSIADVRLEIQDLLARRQSTGSRTVAVTPPPLARISLREAVAWGLVLGLSILATVLLMRPRATADAAPLRLSLVHTDGGEVGIPVISPDGRRVAYSARRADGMPMVWVRDLDRSTPRPLVGTEGGNRLFWSPDSKRVGFVVGAAMKHISADGGPVQVVERRVGGGASWARGKFIIYTNSNGLIQRVDDSGGKSVAVTRLQGPDWGHYWPSMLPDDRHFLFTAKHWAGLAESGAQGIYIGSIDNPTDIRQLLPDLSSAVYAPPGFIVFARDGQVMAAPFDLSGGRVRGEPIALAEAVAVDASFYLAGLSAAADGTLAIRPPPAPLVSSASGPGAFDGELTFVTRNGSVLSSFGGMQKFIEDMAMSPDGKAIAALLQDSRTGGSDLWRFDVESGVRTPLTSMRTRGGYVGAPVWSSDGTRVAYACQPPEILDDVCVLDLRSGVVTTAIQSKATWEHPVAWSADGRHMIVAVNEYTGSSREELRVWSAGTNTLSPFAASGNDALFSPDSRFVAFNSPESGQTEVYVTTFPERRQTWPLTTEGGYVLSWSADGKELLVATLTGHIVAYPVTAGDSFSTGPPQVLVRNVGFDARYALATRDHSRFLIRVPKDADKDRGEIRLLFGWTKGLATAR